VHPEGKYVVDIGKDVDVAKLVPGARVALKNDSYALHTILPSLVDPLVSLMKVRLAPPERKKKSPRPAPTRPPELAPSRHDI
jgi:ATP-dependent 26S proteasome regulatory subunit